MQDSFIPGAAQPAPLLSDFAEEAAAPAENFVGNLIMPDTPVDSFLGISAVHANETLDVDYDDTIGDRTDYPEIIFAEGETSWELGMHGRKAIIGAVAIMKARQAAQMARGGGGTSDPIFDLERNATDTIVKQLTRRNELLRMREILNEDNYPDANVFDPIEIDTTTELRETLIAGAKLVESAGFGPATMIVFGGTAIEGAEKNENVLALLGDDQEKVLTTSLFLNLMRLPEGQASVQFSSALYKNKAGEIVPMMDRYIWIGRAGSTRGVSFGRNYIHPNPENGKTWYVNRLLVGNQENRHIGARGFYRPNPEHTELGVLIPVTLSTDA